MRSCRTPAAHNKKKQLKQVLFNNDVIFSFNSFQLICFTASFIFLAENTFEVTDYFQQNWSDAENIWQNSVDIFNKTEFFSKTYEKSYCGRIAAELRRPESLSNHALMNELRVKSFMHSL